MKVRMLFTFFTRAYTRDRIEYYILYRANEDTVGASHRRGTQEIDVATAQ